LDSSLSKAVASVETVILFEYRRIGKKRIITLFIENPFLDIILTKFNLKEIILDNITISKDTTEKDILGKILEELQTLNQRIEKLEKLDTIDSSIQDSKTAIIDLKNNQNKQNQVLIEAFGKNFEEMNQLLDKIFQKISEGASKEIIQALEQVIRDFDDKLTTQFGENFKEMNYLLDKIFQKISEGASKEIIKALEQVIKDFNNNLTESFGENFKEMNYLLEELSKKF